MLTGRKHKIIAALVAVGALALAPSALAGQAIGTDDQGPADVSLVEEAGPTPVGGVANRPLRVASSGGQEIVGDLEVQDVSVSPWTTFFNWHIGIAAKTELAYATLPGALFNWLSSPFGGDSGGGRPKKALLWAVSRATGSPLASCTPTVRCRDCRCPQVAEPRATRQAAASVYGAPGKPPSLQGIRPLDPGFGSALWR
jgi:hypothetical protein